MGQLFDREQGGGVGLGFWGGGGWGGGGGGGCATLQVNHMKRILVLKKVGPFRDKLRIFGKKVSMIGA